ncbi:hypothetical protein [Amycolatopsis sp. DSM 110486]|uniref:hypothetical protein n=1 Tax=Amycolatopsis sp. DSM 110486 TaxID=2865832 RepID=UPI001C694563|nr:hypothetical protein [Amycolatopsis sp. DSM 110486]QYN24617.1 hypothetical protein K1T34_20575 [Amycolatopsis sp. DSM 110486]
MAGDTAGTNGAGGGVLELALVMGAGLLLEAAATTAPLPPFEHPAAAAATKATAMNLRDKRMHRILPGFPGIPALGDPLVITRSDLFAGFIHCV